KDAVWITNIDGTGEKKIADGNFPAISPDGTRVAFNTVEKTSDTTYVRHIAAVEVATSKVNVFKDVPGGSSYYPSWSSDGKHILFGIEMGEEANRRNWDGPVPALWSFDLHSQHAVRITPKRLFGWDGVWIDNANVLFLSQAAGEKSASIYRMSINGKNLKRLIKDARFPTISAP